MHLFSSLARNYIHSAPPTLIYRLYYRLDFGFCQDLSIWLYLPWYHLSGLTAAWHNFSSLYDCCTSYKSHFHPSNKISAPVLPVWQFYHHLSKVMICHGQCVHAPRLCPCTPPWKKTACRGSPCRTSGPYSPHGGRQTEKLLRNHLMLHPSFTKVPAGKNNGSDTPVRKHTNPDRHRSEVETFY